MSVSHHKGIVIYITKVWCFRAWCVNHEGINPDSLKRTFPCSAKIEQVCRHSKCRSAWSGTYGTPPLCTVLRSISGLARHPARQKNQREIRQDREMGLRLKQQRSCITHSIKKSSQHGHEGTCRTETCRRVALILPHILRDREVCGAERTDGKQPDELTKTLKRHEESLDSRDSRGKRIKVEKGRRQYRRQGRGNLTLFFPMPHDGLLPNMPTS